MASWEKFSYLLEDKRNLDPVGKEDADVDNDGDTDSSDKYLKKRRLAVGAAIAADRKKKVEESLDPVGEEDKDVDNDGDHDKSDKYLLNRRKVRSKIIAPAEKLKTDRDGYRVPQRDADSAKERLLAKAKAKREKVKEEFEDIQEKGMSSDEMSSVMKGHKYSKKQLLDMSKKSTKEGRHGEADALYKEFSKEETNIEEKAVSKAQQRFFGMVRSAQKGEMETPSSEVSKAATSMSKSDVKDFAKTKHDKLPEKKETKEELSLVQKIVEEVLEEGLPKHTISGGKKRAKQYKAVAKQAKLTAAANKVLKGDSSEEEGKGKKTEKERKESSKSQVKRGLSDPSALTRRAAVAGASKLKSEKEKTKRQRERQEYETKRREEKGQEKQKNLEKSRNEKAAELSKKQKEKSVELAKKESDREENSKERRKEELKRDVKGAIKGINVGTTNEKEGTMAVAGQTVSNIGNVGKGIAKVGKAVIKSKLKERGDKKKEEKRKERHAEIDKKMSESTVLSNWREEFLHEVDEMEGKEKKKIDVMKGKNKIEINPNMGEAVVAAIPIGAALGKVLAGTVARAAGGAVAKGIATKGAGVAAKGAMRKKAVDLAARKGGEMSADYVQKKIEKKFKNEDDELEEGAAWTKKSGKSKSGGLNEKGRKSYERENPGSDLKAPSKKKGNKRRASFCARMKGMKAKLTSAKTARDPDSRINKSLRAWNC